MSGRRPARRRPGHQGFPPRPPSGYPRCSLAESRTRRDKPMESITVGRVLTEAKIENLKALGGVKQGLRPHDQARAIPTPAPLVDTGAPLLSPPADLIRQL